MHMTGVGAHRPGAARGLRPAPWPPCATSAPSAPAHRHEAVVPHAEGTRAHTTQPASKSSPKPAEMGGIRQVTLTSEGPLPQADDSHGARP